MHFGERGDRAVTVDAREKVSLFDTCFDKERKGFLFRPFQILIHHPWFDRVFIDEADAMFGRGSLCGGFVLRQDGEAEDD